MKVKPLLQSINPSTFLQDYLTACGVKDVDEYLNASFCDCDNPWDYPNMQEAVDRFHKAIEQKEKIGVLVDVDADGLCSSSLIYNFIKSISPDQPIVYFMHTGKQHGLVQSKEENIVQQIVDNNIQLMIVPDAGTNDDEACSILKAQGIDVLILDHHEITNENPNAIIINHHLGNGLNTALSGTGVTYKFVRAYCDQYKYAVGYNYLDLVATSLVTDICDMTSVENRVYMQYGFNNLQNPMLKAMYDNFNSRGNNQIGVAWGVGPKINAVFRGGTMEVKNAMFQAMIGEYDIDEAIELLKETHSGQSKIVDQVIKEIKPNLDLSQKVLIGYTDVKNKSYTGLIANKLTGEYNKPSIILRELNPTTWTGSMRSPVDIAHEINESGLATCQGHESASGIWFPKSNLDKLIKWFDGLNLSIESIKPVTACITPKQITLSICEACEDNILLWGSSEGSKIVQPKFYVTFETTPDKVTVFAKRTKTVKFTFGDVSILKFRAKADDVEMLQSGKCRVEALVTLETNEWNGNITPQAKVEEWEISKVEEGFEEDWMDLF